MRDFEDNLRLLNAAQRQAVETTEGPVLVVAGPGTGKTQLLAMRAAAIVKRTDTAPQNILCLTFTESAALTMRSRLLSLMGAAGNRVAVHTFHSLGTEIINQNPEHFYNGARFSPANEIVSYQLLRLVFEELPHNNPLAKTMNGEFAALGDAKAAISHLKRAGLLPSELRAILDANQKFYTAAEKPLAAAFAKRLSSKDIPNIRSLVEQLPLSNDRQQFGYKNINEVCEASLGLAVTQAESTGKTTPLTAWRNTWLEKDKQGNLVFKDRLRDKKLRALATIYEQYRLKLSEAELFDFDDMVSLVAHTLETVPELRFNLQEQYLYIMVDEFQDTNGAQLRLLSALGENPVNEDRPNILAVGDDDQAIYAFQGAELNNVLDFTMRYRNVTVITLTQNYRSTAPILNQARSVITQASIRLESTLAHINKLLTPNKSGDSGVELHQFKAAEAEYQWIASTLKASKSKTGEVAVIARHHKQLIALLPYLHAAGISTTYERRNNVLENPQLNELIIMARVVAYIADGQFDQVDELLPELLSCNFWQLKTSDIWQLSLKAYKERRMWLELMLETNGKLRAIAEFLVVTSQQSLHLPLEPVLDILIGAHEVQVPADDHTDALHLAPNGPTEAFVSPLRAFYFSEQRLKKQPEAYLTLLSGLRALRQAAQSYQADKPLRLQDFVELIDLHQRTNTPIIDTGRLGDSTHSVVLTTAHRAKGLEFDTVFVLSCQDDIWGRSARHRYSSLSFPHNLPLEPAGSSYDDALRLFFVAMTRAKQNLYLTCHQTDESSKVTLLAEFLSESGLKPIEHDAPATPDLEQLLPGWQWRHISVPKVKQQQLLQPLLDTYKLSATHVNNFVDVTRGGPQAFLLQNLLRFPQAMTPSQVFGYAIHAVLQRAHTHFTATGERRPIEDVLYDFELQLQHAHLSDRSISYLIQKGSDTLQAYLKARYDTFTQDQIVERNFYGQDVVVADVRLTGVLDVIQVDKAAKTVTVTDYKTGAGKASWRGTTDFDKIKLHKYKQQLMLYKLLVEHSRDFSGYTVTKGVLEFVEPDTEGILHRLELDFNDDELAQFKRLLQTIWQRILQLDLPDTNKYDSSYKGILAFEKDLTA